MSTLRHRVDRRRRRRSGPRSRSAPVASSHTHAPTPRANNNGVYVTLNGLRLPAADLARAQPILGRGSRLPDRVCRRPLRPRPSRSGTGCSCGRSTNSHQARTTAASFDIRDTQGNVYYPVALNPSTNPYVWTAQTLAAAGHRAGARHDGQLRPHAGQPGPVQAEQLGLRQPAAHARHPLRDRARQRSRSTSETRSPLRASVGRGPGRVRAERDRRRARPGERLEPGRAHGRPSGPRRDPGPHRLLAQGQAAVAFGFVNPNQPGGAQASLALLSSGGRPQRLRAVPHTRQVLALGYLAGSLQILGGTSGGGLACCTAIQTLALGSRGFTAPRSLIRGLSGLTVGHLIASGTGELAVFAASSGVWAARAAQDGHFGAPHRLTAAGTAPQSLVASVLHGGGPLVAFTQAPIMSADPPASPRVMLSTGSAPGPVPPAAGRRDVPRPNGDRAPCPRPQPVLAHPGLDSGRRGCDWGQSLRGRARGGRAEPTHPDLRGARADRGRLEWCGRRFRR